MSGSYFLKNVRIVFECLDGGAEAPVRHAPNRGLCYGPSNALFSKSQSLSSPLFLAALPPELKVRVPLAKTRQHHTVLAWPLKVAISVFVSKSHTLSV